MNPLNATLRLQCHAGFTLDDAAAHVGYYSRLGITHLYLSPILQANAGSSHGYDVVDPTRVNQELGGEPALCRLVAALRTRQMGLIVDIVPNHMWVADASNQWWQSVLEWGRSSPRADFFDIDWHSPLAGLRGKVLVPILDGELRPAITERAIKLHFDAERGRFHVTYFDHHLPICPASYRRILGTSDDARLSELANAFAALLEHPSAALDARAQALQDELADLCRQPAHQAALAKQLKLFDAGTSAGADQLERLLDCQHYLLSNWRRAQEIINWRRFFDINQLGSLRVERGEVFEATHAKIFELIERGLIDGLRIDHIDGLADPAHYCRRLRRRLNRLQRGRPRELANQPIPIYVEKILGADEALPAQWPVEGTTGYEFMNEVSLLLHDAQGAAPLHQLWQDCTGRPGDFLQEVKAARRMLLDTVLKADFEKVARGMAYLARHTPTVHDQSLPALRRVLREIVVHFPVYRLYAGNCGRSLADENIMRQVVADAGDALPEADWPLLEQIDRWLGAEPLQKLAPGPLRRRQRQVLTRFHQLTAPVAAKAVEDTAGYRHGVLLSRNDVGFDPEHLAMPISAFHQRCERRAQQQPLTMLTTATHDSKRGEDLRMRLAVISECATWYADNAQQWLRMAEPLRRRCGAQLAPAAHDELMLYQMLIGGWPLVKQEWHDFLPRLQQWQQKALREAKLQSSWWQPDEAYEAACADFLEQLLSAPEQAPLRGAIEAAAMAIAPAGALNSLTQVLLRLTTPGIPDLYQGCELWDFSFVDPDNRRPVDFAQRANLLTSVYQPSVLLASWQDGRIKQWLIATLLQHRLGQGQLYREGRYLPLTVEGESAEHLIAFARELNGQMDIILAPRLPYLLLQGEATPHIPPNVWQRTCVVLPSTLPRDAQLQSLFCDNTFTAEDGRLPVRELLAEFPLQLLCVKNQPQEKVQ